jgi:hypothetical protein
VSHHPAPSNTLEFLTCIPYQATYFYAVPSCNVLPLTQPGQISTHVSQFTLELTFPYEIIPGPVATYRGHSVCAK